MIEIIAGLAIVVSYLTGLTHGRNQLRREAIKAGKARWLVDEAGEITFKWND